MNQKTAPVCAVICASSLPPIQCSFFAGLTKDERVRADRVGHILGYRQAEQLMTFIALQEPPLQGSALIRAIVEAISALTSRMLVEAVHLIALVRRLT